MNQSLPTLSDQNGENVQVLLSPISALLTPENITNALQAILQAIATLLTTLLQFIRDINSSLDS